MEKRFVLALLITFVFLFFWSYLGPKPPSPVQRTQPPTTETVPVSPLETAPSFPGGVIEAAGTEFKQADIGNFSITYSETGGYIKNISPKAKNGQLLFHNIGYSDEDCATVYASSVTTNSLEFKSSDGRLKRYTFDGYKLSLYTEPQPEAQLLFSISLKPNSQDPGQRYQEFFLSRDTSIVRTSPQKTKSDIQNGISFAGVREQYYCFSLLKGDHQIKWFNDKTTGYLYLMNPAAETSVYLGPHATEYMQPYGLQGIINYGFFHGIGVIMVKVLYLLHAVGKNWGVTIILFSIVTYAFLFPFTASSMKAMRKIQEIQPELEAMKVKYKDDQQKLNKEMVEFYKKHKINPLGGCLPLLFQFPVFIALYQVIFRFYDLKDAQFLWIKDLALPDALFKLPFTVPLLNTNLFNLLPLLVMLLGALQQHFTASSTANSQQKSMGLFMSIFIGIIFYNFPSALVLYWFTQNVLSFGYQLRLAKARGV